MSYEQIQTDGFTITLTAAAANILHAGFGDGYDTAKVMGAELRKWSIKIEVLPAFGSKLVDGQTRADYLWDFYVASKIAGNKPFWIQDPKDDRFYLASFAGESLGYDILRSKAYSTGLELEQRRVTDQDTPVDAIP
jgi:hypothetical protein